MLSVGVTVFTSTMFAHVVGSLLYEMLLWPLIISDVNSWVGIWQATTIAYPFERLAITIAGTVLGTALLKSLKKWYKPTILQEQNVVSA